MRYILGIDLGTRDYGMALIELPETLVRADSWHMDSGDLFTRIRHIKRSILAVVDAWKPICVFVEDFTTQKKRVTTWREMCLLLGSLADIPDLVHIPLETATAGLWKSQLLGPQMMHILTSRGYDAKDKVRWALEQRLGKDVLEAALLDIKPGQQEHAIDAAGLALWGADRWQQYQLVKGA